MVRKPIDVQQMISAEDHGVHLFFHLANTSQCAATLPSGVAFVLPAADSESMVPFRAVLNWG